MPRLTLDLIQRSEQGLNPCKDRQLSLRGNKIEVIENMGASQDAFTAIDLSDNGIIKLGGVPKLARLKTLLVANNCIKRIDEEFGKEIPNLNSIVLTNNKLSTLADLNPLGKVKSLERLSLLGNPITKLPHYRKYVIYALRNTKLRVLDFIHIKDADRESALKFFGGEGGTERIKEFAPPRISAEEAEKEKLDTLDSSAVERIKQAIVNATTLAEVTRLEKVLKDGKISAEALEELLKPQDEKDKRESVSPDREKSKSRSRSPSRSRSVSPDSPKAKSKGASSPASKASKSKSPSKSPKRAASDKSSSSEKAKSPKSKKSKSKSPSPKSAKKRSRSRSKSVDSDISVRRGKSKTPSPKRKKKTIVSSSDEDSG